MEKIIPEMEYKIKDIEERVQNMILDDKNQGIMKIVGYLDSLGVDI